MILNENNINIKQKSDEFLKENISKNQSALNQKVNCLDDKNIDGKKEIISKKIEEKLELIADKLEEKEINNNENLKEKIDLKGNNFYEEYNCQTIAISGSFGSGKSVISSILSKYISSKNKKTLLIDFDVFNSSINTIFGIKKYNKNIDKLNINNYIFSINNNLNILCGIDRIIDITDEKNLYKLKEIINLFKKEYDFIVIDTSSRTDFKYVRLVLSSSNKIIFLIEPNLLELKKSNSMIEIIVKDWDIEIDKIKIVFNKCNKYKIAASVLEEIFSEFEIVGEIEYEDKYSLFVNKNSNSLFEENEYEKIFEKVKI